MSGNFCACAACGTAIAIVSIATETDVWLDLAALDFFGEFDRVVDVLDKERERQAEAEALVNEREQGDTQFDEESGEGDTISVERERDLMLSATAHQAVEEIDHALAKFDLGTYGICESCGNPIGKGRAMAFPRATLCMTCKQREERR